MKKPMTLIAVILLFGALTPLALAGKEQRPLAIEDALAMLSFQQSTPIDLSPDGEWVAYTLQDFRKAASVKDERYRVFTRTGTPVLMAGCDVWIAHTKSGEARNLTEGKGSSWGAVWSPDGGCLAFYSDRSGQAHLWVWEKSSGALRQISDAIVRSIGAYQVPRWTPDGRKILTKVLPAETTIEAAGELISGPPGETAVRRDSSQPSVIVYRSPAASKQIETGSLESEAWTNASLGDLALIDAASGNLQRIARGLKPHGYWISPDGSHIAFTHFKGFEAVNSTQFVYDLSVVSLAEGQLRVVAPNIRLSYFGLSVSWSPDGKALSYTTSGPQAKGDCFIVALSEGAPRLATDSPHPNFGDPLRPPLWDASGESLFFLSADTLWKISLRRKTVAPVTRIPNKKLVEVVSPAGAAHFWSPDGGRTIYLSTRDEATKQVGFYQVDLETGKYSKLFEKAVELGIADPDRLGVMGHSYGGYSTLALIVQTTRFKAAICKAGLGNLIGAYGQMLNDGAGFSNKFLEAGQLRMGGTPWEFRDRYIENSPVFYLDRVRTPLLLIHGTLDFNVAPFLADEIFIGLQRLGKEVEYAKYEGEDHSQSLWGYANHL